MSGTSFCFAHKRAYLHTEHKELAKNTNNICICQRNSRDFDNIFVGFDSFSPIKVSFRGVPRGNSGELIDNNTVNVTFNGI